MIYELYINDILVDLDENTSINLLYKSPIFGDLNSIQSNRSYNVSLPLTITNKKAIDMSHRVDSTSRLPYDYIPAKLYANSVPIFETGFAVITSVAETISLTLTWGNVDNFKPLFEDKLADLFDYPEYIKWDADGFENTTPYMKFFEFNSGVKDSAAPLRYLHPCVDLMAIIARIESANNLQFPDRVKHLAGLKPWLLLTERKTSVNASLNKDNLSTSTVRIPIMFERGGMVEGFWVDVTKDPQQVLFNKGNATEREPVVKVENSSVFSIDASSILTFKFSVNANTAMEFSTHLDALDSQGELIETIHDFTTKYSLSGSDPNIKTATVTVSLSIIKQFEIKDDWFYIGFRLNVGAETEIYEVTQLWTSGPVTVGVNKNEAVYPGVYSLNANLPDMTQGEFISEFMTYNGLFAYPNQDNPNQIDFFSVNDIYDKRDAGEALDWSDKLLLNEMGELSMADDMSYETFDYAQSNTLDYDNDDDVVAKTEGTITVANKRLDREQELFKSKFSASMMSGGQVYAPLYSLGENGEVSDETIKERIVVSDEAETAISFPAEAYFGGNNGIVADEYQRLHELIQNSRILTFRFKLSMLDVKAARFETPIYLNQFEAYFVLYSLTTSTSGICEVELIKM